MEYISSCVNNYFAYVCVIGTLIKIYYNYAFNYWTVKNIPTIITPTIPFGTLPMKFLLTENFGFYFKQGYLRAKTKGFKYVGAYLCTRPSCHITDIKCIKDVLQKNFDHFSDRGFYHNEKHDPLSANLFAIGGNKWRRIRTALSPAFTSGKLKIMFDGVLQCARQTKTFVAGISDERRPLDAKDLFERFTIDVIGSCAFGVDCNSFINPDAEFRQQGKKIFSFDKMRSLKAVFAFAYSSLACRLGVRLFEADTTEFFVGMVRNAIEYREANGVARGDFLQLLIEMRKSGGFTIEELTAQAFIFFAAGYETSSITMTFALYELATRTDIQDRIRDEVQRTLEKHGGKLTYDSVMDLKYLHQVVEETLRKYPPVSFITRSCVKHYKIPDSDATIGEGDEVCISILGMHHDPEIYPEPDRFDPDRFSEENKRNRDPFSYMPFGEGPRMCIGLRFGLTQVKVGLAILLQHYRFTWNDSTKVPLRFNPYSFTLSPLDAVLLNVEKCVI